MARTQPRRVTIPPDLFAESWSRCQNVFPVAVRMTMEYLMVNGYIQLTTCSPISRYRCILYFIIASADRYYESHDRLIKVYAHKGRENYEKYVKNMFLHVYEQHISQENDIHFHLSQENEIHFRLVMTCVLAMNICGYIQRHRMHKWYLYKTISLLARFVCGERFQRDTNYDILEQLVAPFHAPNYRSVQFIENRCRRGRVIEHYLNEEHFRNAINDAATWDP